MSNETKKQIAKAAPNRWLVFCILTFSGGIAFKLSSMKDMFYVPMQEFMGLSNTQIGAALSVYGIVQTIGLIAGIYICDIISKKYMIGGSLLGIGVVGFYIATFPGYYGFLLAFGVLAVHEAAVVGLDVRRVLAGTFAERVVIVVVENDGSGAGQRVRP